MGVSVTVGVKVIVGVCVAVGVEVGVAVLVNVGVGVRKSPPALETMAREARRMRARMPMITRKRVFGFMGFPFAAFGGDEDTFGH